MAIERTGTRLTVLEQSSRMLEFRGRPLAIEAVKAHLGFDRRLVNILANLPAVLAARGVELKVHTPKVYTPMGLELNLAALIGKSGEDIAQLASSVDALSRAYKVSLADQLGVNMIALPAGEFVFQGVGGVKFRGCRVAEIPFTNGQFRKLLKLEPERLATIVDNPQERLERSLSTVDPNYKNEVEDAPMVYVRHPEAEGIAKLIGKRLPTELEWERAVAYIDGRKYPFGDQFDEAKVTFNGKGSRSVYAHIDGASPEGVLDLSGNVSEWTATPYGNIDLSDPKNPKLPVEGITIVLRSGSWHCSSTTSMESSYRYGGGPIYPLNYIGFRFAED